jgi:hypothetical protein
MKSVAFLTRLPRHLAWIGIGLGVATLSACYVAPLQQPSAPAAPVTYSAPAVPITFSARLYPANEAAAAYGMVTAVVTNDLQGRGVFSTAIHGENFSGEATRTSGSSREGVANGAGNRGSYINCRYTMNSATLGTGRCHHSNGAQFTMHVGG